MSDAVTPEEATAVRETIRGRLGEEPVEIRKASRHSGRQVFFVALAGREVVLKVLHTRKPRSVGCDFAVSSLEKAGVPTPRVLAVGPRNQENLFGLPFLIMERASGIPLDRWVLAAKPPRGALDKILRHLGGCLRKMHRIPATRGFGVIDDSGKARFRSWADYLAEHRVRQTSGRLVRVLDLRRVRESLDLSGDAIKQIEAVFNLGDNPSGLSAGQLLHNDLTLKNVLVDPGQLRVTAVIDLHNALAGHPALELARFHYFYRGRGYLSALLAGYGTTRQAVGPEFARYFTFVLLEKLAWLEGREGQFPGRLESDLELLKKTLATLRESPPGTATVAPPR